jgi:hypothetical protein
MREDLSRIHFKREIVPIGALGKNSEQRRFFQFDSTRVLKPEDNLFFGETGLRF